MFDIAGRNLGRPAEIVRIRTEADVADALRVAREARRPFVAIGRRTTYWHNVHLEGAVVADMTGFDRHLGLDREAGFATVESGASIREVDRWLRGHGFHLPIHPDSYGDTPVGSAIANGVSAGIGMMLGDFGSQVRGLRALLADGRTIEVGASRFLTGKAGPIGRGLPDLRSLLIGAEGALAVVTEVDLALIPTPFEARIELDSEDDLFEALLPFAHEWRGRGCPDTIRFCLETGGQLALRASSPMSEAELSGRVERLVERLSVFGRPVVHLASAAERAGLLPDYDLHWPGPAGAAWRNDATHPFAGIDAVVPYANATAFWAWAKQVRPSPPHGKRLAGYYGPDGVNVGLHCMFGSAEERAVGRAELDARLVELAALDLVPYKPGATWMPLVRSRAHAETLDVLGGIARFLDPTRMLNPRVGVFGAGDP